MTADLMTALEPVSGIARCAGCGSEYTRWVRAGALRNELCLACGACWQVDARGRPVRVSMRECEGCGFQAVCLAGSA